MRGKEKADDLFKHNDIMGQFKANNYKKEKYVQRDKGKEKFPIKTCENHGRLTDFFLCL